MVGNLSFFCPRMERRVYFLVFLLLGVLSLIIGSFLGNWVRVYYFSTQICLSCMGLV